MCNASIYEDISNLIIQIGRFKSKHNLKEPTYAFHLAGMKKRLGDAYKNVEEDVQALGQYTRAQELYEDSNHTVEAEGLKSTIASLEERLNSKST